MKQRYWIASNRLQLVRYFALNMFFCTKLSEKYLFLVNLYTVILTQIWIVWVSKNTWLFLKHYFKLTFSRISIAISLYYPTFMVVLKKIFIIIIIIIIIIGILSLIDIASIILYWWNWQHCYCLIRYCYSFLKSHS